MTQRLEPARLPTTGPVSGLDLITHLNATAEALATLQSASVAPSSPMDGMAWLDVSARDQAQLKIYDGRGGRWLAALTLDLNTGSAGRNAVALMPVAQGGTGASDAAGARESLGLGALAVEARVSARHLGAGAVGAEALADGAVGATKLAPGAVGASVLASAAVGASKLAAGVAEAAWVGERYAKIGRFGVGSYAIGMRGGRAGGGDLVPGQRYSASSINGPWVGRAVAGIPTSGTWVLVARWHPAGFSDPPNPHLFLRVA